MRLILIIVRLGLIQYQLVELKLRDS